MTAKHVKIPVQRLAMNYHSVMQLFNRP